MTSSLKYLKTGFVSVPMGYKNSAGSWIVRERVEQIIMADTVSSQIVVTRGNQYTLTHVHTGYFLLGNFYSIPQAKAAAEYLTVLFPVDDWNIMAEISGALARSRIRAKWEALPLSDKRWMEKFGGPRIQ